jgi:hypothetical protein
MSAARAQQYVVPFTAVTFQGARSSTIPPFPGEWRPPGAEPLTCNSRAEQIAYDLLASRGMLVLKRGWPDFIVLDKSGVLVACVEVKDGRDSLSPHQEKVATALMLAGIACYEFRPQTGFQLIRAYPHRYYGPPDPQADIPSGTEAMSCEEYGFFIRLRDQSRKLNGIPNEQYHSDSKVWGVGALPPQRFKKLWNCVQHFFVESNGRYIYGPDYRRQQESL